MNRRLLFVDDDPNILDAFRRNLRRDFEFDTAVGGAEALALLDAGHDYAAVLADMRMPGLNGVELLELIRRRAPDTVRMMLTGNADQGTAIDAINRGHIFRFLNKPAEPDILRRALEDALAQHALLHTERVLLEETLSGSVKLLTDVLAMVAPEALGRGQRLRDSMVPFARDIDASPLWELEIAALLSSIGCTAIPPRLLLKFQNEDPLTVAEADIRRRIPRMGHDLLASIPRLEGVARIILYQDLRYDGSGGIDGAPHGADIPLGARMLKILNDRLDLEADGVVKRAAFVTMQKREGHYDPDLLVHCFSCFGAFLINPLSSARPIQSVSAAALCPGQVVVSAITSVAGVLLVGSGLRLTSPVIERIRNNVAIGEVIPPFMVQDPPDDVATPVIPVPSAAAGRAPGPPLPASFSQPSFTVPSAATARYNSSHRSRSGS